MALMADQSFQTFQGSVLSRDQALNSFIAKDPENPKKDRLVSLDSYGSTTSLKKGPGIMPLAVPYYPYCGGCDRKNRVFLNSAYKTYCGLTRIGDGMKFVIQKKHLVEAKEDEEFEEV